MIRRILYMSALVFPLLASIPTEITWQSPISLSDPTVSGDSQVIVLNAANQAIALWRRHDGTNDTIQGRFFQNGSWGSLTSLSASGQEIRLSNGSGDQSQSMWAGLNTFGKGVGVWTRKESGFYILQASIFDGNTWSTPSDLSPPLVNADNPQVAINNAGLIIAIWEEDDGGSYAVKAATHNGSYWSSPITLQANAGSHHPFPQIALNDNKAIAIWSNSSSGLGVLEVSYYQDGWSLPTPITDGSKDATFPDIDINTKGEAAAIWREGITAQPYVIRGALYNGTTWLDNVTLSQGGNDATAARVSINDGGKAMGIWQNSGLSLTSITIQTCTIPATSSPSPTVVALSTDIIQDATNGDIALNDQNHAISVWKQSDGSDFIVRSAYYNGSSWVLPGESLSQPGENSETPIDVSFNNNQLGAVIWKRSDGIHDIVQAIFSLSPPKAISGVQKVNRFPFESVYFNRVAWLPSISANVLSYNVYRNEILVASIPSSGSLVYDDYNINPSASYTYIITSVDNNGVESLPQIILID